MVPLDEFYRNLDKLIKKAKKYTDKIFLLGCKKVDESRTKPVPWATDYNYTNEKIMEYNEKIKLVANNNGVAFIEMFDLLEMRIWKTVCILILRVTRKIFKKVKSVLSGEGILNPE